MEKGLRHDRKVKTDSSDGVESVVEGDHKDRSLDMKECEVQVRNRITCHHKGGNAEDTINVKSTKI
jgi:hypothetical protein